MLLPSVKNLTSWCFIIVIITYPRNIDQCMHHCMLICKIICKQYIEVKMTIPVVVGFWEIECWSVFVNLIGFPKGDFHIFFHHCLRQCKHWWLNLIFKTWYNLISRRTWSAHVIMYIYFLEIHACLIQLKKQKQVLRKSITSCTLKIFVFNTAWYARLKKKHRIRTSTSLCKCVRGKWRAPTQSKAQIRCLASPLWWEWCLLSLCINRQLSNIIYYLYIIMYICQHTVK